MSENLAILHLSIKMIETNQMPKDITFYTNHMVDNIFECLNSSTNIPHYDAMMRCFRELPPEFSSVILRGALEQWNSGSREHVVVTVVCD